MRTLQFEIQDDIYQDILTKGINIQMQFKEFLHNLLNEDTINTIDTYEARKRVSKAMDRYKNGTGEYLDEKEYSTHINNTLQNLQVKYANN